MRPHGCTAESSEAEGGGRFAQRNHACPCRQPAILSIPLVPSRQLSPGVGRQRRDCRVERVSPRPGFPSKTRKICSLSINCPLPADEMG